MKYQSEIIKDIIENNGHHVTTNPHYEVDCINEIINDVRGSYPKLCDYMGEWMNYANEHMNIGKFPIERVTDVTNARFENVVPYDYKSAILKGSTKYHDIDTGEILETFEEGRNLELVSVKMPVLTTSNEDGTKTNILTVNEEVELRGLGDMQDELNCLTGEFVQRIGEIILDDGLTYTKTTVVPPGTDTNIYSRFYIENIPNYNSQRMFADRFRVDGYNYIGERLEYGTNGRAGIMILKSRLTTDDVNGLKAYLRSNPITIQYKLATEPIKTVDLSCLDENNNPTKFKPYEGVMNVVTSSETLPPLLDMEVPVEAITQNLMSFIK